MVSACIYLEGGAKGPDSKLLRIACQRAFHKLLDRMGFTGRKPKLVACGGRGAVYERFCTVHRSGTCDYVAMWIDSEEPMASIEDAWNHLANVTTVPKWEKPDGVSNEIDMTFRKNSLGRLGAAEIASKKGKRLT